MSSEASDHGEGDQLSDARQPDARTVIVLGASNVSLAWSEIVSLVLSTTSDSVNLVTAHGMGRAYASDASGFAFWRRPGILKCGLWDHLRDNPVSRSSSVLLTDLGNDLLFGRSVSEVLSAADVCLERIREWDSKADVILTGPPVASVRKLGSFRFRFLRQVLFPSCSLSLQDVQQRTEQLAAGVQELVQKHQTGFYKVPVDCFGLDPIHIRARFRKSVFREALSHWGQSPSDIKWSRFPKAIPQEVTVGRKKRFISQPVSPSSGLKVFAF